jgi:hypothetical protein
VARALADAGVMRQAWEPMTLRYLGDVHELLKGGGGKLSPMSFDTGNVRKPPGQR